WNTRVLTTRGSMRSLAYWPGDKQASPQILCGTEDGELYSINAKTGKLNSDFGIEGIVNLKTPEIMNGFTNFQYGITSAPFIYKNLVITSAHIPDETGSKGPAGDVRAWDVRSGKLVWTFHTVPRPGEMGHETWLGDAWKKMSGANVWSFFSADAARGIIYLPLGSVNNDYYGVDRPGPNLFANSIVACRELLEKVGGGRNRGPFTPYSAEGALAMPYILGGATWSGGAFDPTLGYYIINTTDSGEMGIIRQQDSDPNAPAESPRLFG